MKVIVASKNPVKINCTKMGFRQVFPNLAVEVEGINTSSVVADQPMTNQETLIGAKNRAMNAQS